MTDKLPGTKFLVFAAVCLVAAGWVASVSGNIAYDRLLPSMLPFLDDAKHFTAELEEAAGLVVGDDVRISGVDVGRVNAIRLEEGVAVVDFVVDDHIEPTTSWQTGARWRNVIGQRFLYLYPNPGGVPLEEGDRIDVSQSVPVADLAAFVNQLSPLLEAISPESQNKLTEALNDVLIGREGAIQELVVNLTGLADTVAGQEPEIRAVIANANLLLGEYNAREAELTGFIDQLSSVSETLASRNGELLDAAVDITRVQAELGRMIAANDDGLASALDDVEQVTARIGDQRQAFEDSIASLRQGFASYMLTSRSGQWFNVRGVAVQVQDGDRIVYCQTEGGTDCAFPNDPRAAAASPPPGESTSPLPPPPGIPSIPTSGSAVGSEEVLVLAPARLDAMGVVARLPLAPRADEPAAGGGGG